MGDAIDHDARLVQPIEEFTCLLRADRLVAEEVAVGVGRRLADIVDERGEADDRVATSSVDCAKRVVPEILPRSLVLGNAPLGRELG
jgi:hypothetical protein